MRIRSAPPLILDRLSMSGLSTPGDHPHPDPLPSRERGQEAASQILRGASECHGEKGVGLGEELFSSDEAADVIEADEDYDGDEEHEAH